MVRATNPTVPLGVKLPAQGNYTLNANSIAVVGDHKQNRHTAYYSTSTSLRARYERGNLV
ncbi:MAG: hypothetical protein K9J17_09455 [Flavobacteriales bacterium]|nr:hypothetical protein [Flavobacteriales bacterium]